MTSELKDLHPYLYKRVRLKGIVLTLLGLSALFSTYLDRIFNSVRPNSDAGVSTTLSGIIFLVIGLGVFYGLYAGRNLYRTVSRGFLYAGFLYALFWEFILIELLIAKHIPTISIFILWGYLTYNLLLISKDSAWRGAEVVREIREDNGE